MIYEQHQGFSIETNKRSKHYSMSEPHYHDAYEIYIPLSGKSTLMIGDEILCIEPDRVAVINALVPHGNFSKYYNDDDSYEDYDYDYDSYDYDDFDYQNFDYDGIY